jgi:hypothetical protein
LCPSLKEKEEQKIGYIFILSLLKKSDKSQSFLRAKETEMGKTFFILALLKNSVKYQSFVRAKQQKRESETERLAPVLL